MEHPSEEVLLRFLLGAASRPENRAVVRHLLARCPACAATLQHLRHEPPLNPPPSPDAYLPAFHHVAAFVLRLTHKADPPPRLVPVAAEEDPRPDSATTGNTARRRWLFG